MKFSIKDFCSKCDQIFWSSFFIIFCALIIRISKHKISKSSNIINFNLPGYSKERKTCLLMGDFNVNLLNIENKSGISEFCFVIIFVCFIYPSANENHGKLSLTIYFYIISNSAHILVIQLQKYQITTINF